DDERAQTTEGDTTTSVEANPYELPLEERPPLFDPCTEIPEEALEEAGFTPEDKDQNFFIDDHAMINGCQWTNDDLMLSVASYWYSLEEMVANNDFQLQEPFPDQDRSGQFFKDPNRRDGAELAIFSTTRGVVIIDGQFASILPTFRGEPTTDLKAAFITTSIPLVNALPEDF
ncbi:MAG: DUF3558 family protein, partial [Brachybacterium sp.]|nr:DUF3558 family protein [Brachybacterium sp.]